MPLQLPLPLLPPLLLLLPSLPLLNLSGRNYLNDVILDSIACPEITPCAFIIRSCRPSHEMKMRRLDKLIQHLLLPPPFLTLALPLPFCYALIWHAVHVERKLFRKALFMLRHKFNANKEAQAAAPRSRPHHSSPSHFPTPCGPQKAAPRCAREIYLTAAASLSPFLLFDAALDEMAAAVAVAVADTPWAWAGCLCVCVCEATWRWYKIKFQLLTNIYALPDKSGIKLWRRAAQTVQSAKCKV